MKETPRLGYWPHKLFERSISLPAFAVHCSSLTPCSLLMVLFFTGQNHHYEGKALTTKLGSSSLEKCGTSSPFKEVRIINTVF
jgi:hypothetical protein